MYLAFEESQKDTERQNNIYWALVSLPLKDLSTFELRYDSLFETFSDSNPLLIKLTTKSYSSNSSKLWAGLSSTRSISLTLLSTTFAIPSKPYTVHTLCSLPLRRTKEPSTKLHSIAVITKVKFTPTIINKLGSIS
jgi:hypothetical protein